MDLATPRLPEAVVVVIGLYGILFAVLGICTVINHFAGRPRLNGWLFGAAFVIGVAGLYLWAVDPLERFHDANRVRANSITIATVALLIVWPAVWRGLEWRKRRRRLTPNDTHDA